MSATADIGKNVSNTATVIIINTKLKRYDEANKLTRYRLNFHNNNFIHVIIPVLFISSPTR
jgi:hypothetical protein